MAMAGATTAPLQGAAIDPETALVWAFFSPFLLLGTYMIGKGVQYVVRSRRMASRAPVSTTRIGGESGTVEVEGTARRHEETLTHPRHDTECVAYVHKHSQRENEHGTEERAVPFVVEDDDGAVLVDPDDATLTFSGDRALRDGDTVHVVGAGEGTGPEATDDGTKVYGTVRASQVTDSAASGAPSRVYRGGVRSILGGLLAFGVTLSFLWYTGYL